MSLMKISSSNETLLELKHITKIEQRSSLLGFFHKNTVINDLSFVLKENESLGIVGDENSGKDLLVAIIAGLRNPTKGEILYYGTSVTDVPRERHANIRMLFNNTANALNPKMRIRDLLEIPLLINTDLSDHERHAQVAETLTLVDLTPDIAYKYPTTLSIGQRKRVALARALILNPRILLANKTMSSFDPIMRTYIASLFVRLKKERQISTIISTSDLDILSRTCEKILVMDQGKLVEFGNTNEIISTSTNDITRKLIKNYENEYRYHMQKINK